MDHTVCTLQSHHTCLVAENLVKMQNKIKLNGVLLMSDQKLTNTMHRLQPEKLLLFNMLVQVIKHYKFSVKNIHFP